MVNGQMSPSIFGRYQNKPLISNVRCPKSFICSQNSLASKNVAKCSFVGLALTVKGELWIISNLQSSSQRPASSYSTATAVSKMLLELEVAIGNETSRPEHVLQGRICLAWLRFTMEEYSGALSGLSRDLKLASDTLAKEGGITSRWTHVCIVRGALIKGENLDRSAKEISLISLQVSFWKDWGSRWNQCIPTNQ